MTVSLGIMMGAVVLGLGAQASRADAPAAHPSLFYKSQAELDAHRQRFNDPRFAAYRTMLLRGAERACVLPIDIKNTSRTADPCNMMLWAYLLSGETKYKTRLMAWMDPILEDHNVKSYGFMQTGMAAGVYDTLYHELTPAQRERFEAYLEAALRAHVKQRGGYFLESTFNSQMVMNGPAGIAALMLRGKADAKLVDGTIAYAVKRAKDWVERMLTEDGGYHEGTLYWYSVPNYLMLAHALKNVTGDDQGLLDQPRFRKFQDFMMVILGGDGSLVTFSNTQPWLAGMVMCADFGNRFDQPGMRALADHMATVQARRETEGGELNDVTIIPALGALKQARHFADVWPIVSDRGAFLPYAFLWRGQAPPAERLQLPTLAKMDVIQWGVLRSESLAPQLVVQVKGRAPGLLLFHDIHEDAGSFVLQSRGEMFLLDRGYTPDNKLDGPAALNHTVPVIDGQVPRGGKQGRSSGPELSSTITEAWETADLRVMVIDSTPAYVPAAQRVRRLLVMSGASAVVVLDDIESAAGGPGRVVSYFQTAQATELAKDATRAVITGRASRLTLQFDGPVPELARKGPVDFKNSWIYAAYAKAGWFQWNRLEVTYAARGDLPLVTVCLPGELQAAPGSAKVERRKDAVVVTLPNQQWIEFRREPTGWVVVRPPGTK